MSGPQPASHTAMRSLHLVAAGLLASLVAACGGSVPQKVETTTAETAQVETAQAETTPGVTIQAPVSGPDDDGTAINGGAVTLAASDTGRRHDTVTSAGHYLAARQALYFNDVGTSATFFLETLEAEVDSIPLLRQAFLTQYYYGDIERAAALGVAVELGDDHRADCHLLFEGAGLVVRRLADQALSVFSESHHRGCGTCSFRVFENSCFPCFHHRHT